MDIAGFIPLSLVDYPGQVCAVIFTQGCNMRCPFCHNSDLIPIEKQLDPMLSWVFIRNQLNMRRDMVSSVVISGGEPTLQKDLIPVLQDLRELKFQIKLDTNGTNPKKLEVILGKGLVDFIALDIKAPFDHRMDEAIGRSYMLQLIQGSLAVIQNGVIPFEIRTTCHNGIDGGALRSIATLIPENASWVLQRCRSHGSYQAQQRSSKWANHQRNDLHQIVPNIRLRGWM